MSHSIEQRVRGVLAAILFAGVVVGSAGFANAGEQLDAFRLAQATPKAGEPQRQAAAPQGPAGGMEGQIADLRRKLAITPAQQTQFDTLAQAMRQNGQELESLVQQEQPKGKPSAVEAVRAAGKFAEAQAAGIKRLLPPLEGLYGNLSDQQKRAADQVFASAPEPEQPQGKRR